MGVFIQETKFFEAWNGDRYMNLSDAIKSGKRFRQRGKDLWLKHTDKHCFSVAQVLSEDWEVEPESVTITRNQFNQAWENAFKIMWEKKDTDHSIKMADLVAKELGL